MGVIYEIQLNHPEKAEKHRDKVHFYGPTPNKTYFASAKSMEEASHLKIPFQIFRSLDAGDESILPIIQSFPAILMSAPNQSAKNEVRAYTMAFGRLKEKPSIVYLGRDVDITRDPDAFVLDEPGGARRYTWKIIYNQKGLPHYSLEKSFSRISKRIKDRDTKVVLALSGGGLKVFTHTTLMKFLNFLGLYDEIDEIWGTSGGAVAGLWYACGITPEQIQKHGYALYNRLFSLKLSPSKIEVIKNLFLNYCLPERFKPAGFLGLVDSSKSVRHFINSLKKDSMPKKPFYCIAFNVQTLQVDILTSEKMDPQIGSGKIYHADPVEAAMASSSIPVLFVPQIIKRNGTAVHYIDGGLEENIPMKSVYEKWIADKKSGREKRKKLLLILSSVEGSSRLNLFNTKRFLRDQDLAMISYNLLFQAIENSHRALLAQDPNVETWDFQVPLAEYPIFNAKLIPKFIKLGYQEVADKSLEIEKRLTPFKSRGKESPPPASLAA